MIEDNNWQYFNYDMFNQSSWKIESCDAHKLISQGETEKITWTEIYPALFFFIFQSTSSKFFKMLLNISETANIKLNNAINAFYHNDSDHILLHN